MDRQPVLEGERPCDPCRHLEEHLGHPGLKDALRGRTLREAWSQIAAQGPPVHK